MTGYGRFSHLVLQIERQLSEPLLTKSLEAARRRYLPVAVIRQLNQNRVPDIEGTPK